MIFKIHRKGIVLVCLVITLMLSWVLISCVDKSSNRPTAADISLAAATPITRSSEHGRKYVTSVEDVPDILLPPHVLCDAIFDGHTAAIETAKVVDYQVLPELQYDSMSNCTAYVTQRRFLLYPVSREEEEFPIGFSIVIFADWTRAERLLRAIYRPHNVYCLHIDRKAPQTVHRSLAAVARCLGDNILVPDNRVDVYWGQYSVLEAELVCMRALLASGRPFKYFINLTGQEFPLKTNLDLVRILSTFNGANDIQSSPLEGLRVTHVYRNGRMTSERKSPPPHNITLMKGQVHVVTSRAFVDYVITSNVSTDLLEWLRDTCIPDETFFASLNHYYHHHQVGTRGVLRGQTQSVSRFKGWIGEGYECQGKYIRGICIIGVGDLPALVNSTQLFVNKLHYNYQSLAYDCLEQLHYNRTREDILYPLKHRIDLNFYRNLDFVKLVE